MPGSRGGWSRTSARPGPGCCSRWSCCPLTAPLGLGLRRAVGRGPLLRAASRIGLDRDRLLLFAARADAAARPGPAPVRRLRLLGLAWVGRGPSRRGRAGERAGRRRLGRARHRVGLPQCAEDRGGAPGRRADRRAARRPRRLHHRPDQRPARRADDPPALRRARRRRGQRASTPTWWRSPATWSTARCASSRRMSRRWRPEVARRQLLRHRQPRVLLGRRRLDGRAAPARHSPCSPTSTWRSGAARRRWSWPASTTSAPATSTGTARSDPAQALAGSPPAALRLLLAHQPRSAEAAEAAGFDLQLSGHTHGGQFLPWNFLVRLQQPFTAGLKRWRRMWVYTSRGTGYWGPPKRFGAPSEITLLRLVAARPAVAVPGRPDAPWAPAASGV